MALYRTGLWYMDFCTPFPPQSGKGWKAKIENTGCVNIENNQQWLESRRFVPPSALIDLPDGSTEIRCSSEIFAEAAERLAAQRALNLIRACFAIRNGDVFADFEGAIAIPDDPARTEDLTEVERDRALRAQHLATHGLGHACGMALKASHRRSLQYAAHKLFLSLQTISTSHVNIDPSYSPRLFGVEKEPANHVRLANAITLAYSAIEEMQLEPRGSNDKPSSRPDGTWDPERLADLERRLTTAGIDTSEKIVWTARGTPSLIERSARSPKGGRASWARRDVRDSEVPITDALRFASWIRSGVTTHKFVKLTRSVTFYDAYNVQFIARRLIMEHLGYWL